MQTPAYEPQYKSLTHLLELYQGDEAIVMGSPTLSELLLFKIEKMILNSDTGPDENYLKKETHEGNWVKTTEHSNKATHECLFSPRKWTSV